MVRKAVVLVCVVFLVTVLGYVYGSWSRSPRAGIELTMDGELGSMYRVDEVGWRSALTEVGYEDLSAWYDLDTLQKVAAEKVDITVRVTPGSVLAVKQDLYNPTSSAGVMLKAVESEYDAAQGQMVYVLHLTPEYMAGTGDGVAEGIAYDVLELVYLNVHDVAVGSSEYADLWEQRLGRLKYILPADIRTSVESVLDGLTRLVVSEVQAACTGNYVCGRLATRYECSTNSGNTCLKPGESCDSGRGICSTKVYCTQDQGLVAKSCSGFPQSVCTSRTEWSDGCAPQCLYSGSCNWSVSTVPTATPPPGGGGGTGATCGDNKCDIDAGENCGNCGDCGTCQQYGIGAQGNITSCQGRTATGLSVELTDRNGVVKDSTTATENPDGNDYQVGISSGWTDTDGACDGQGSPAKLQVLGGGRTFTPNPYSQEKCGSTGWATKPISYKTINFTETNCPVPVIKYPPACINPMTGPNQITRGQAGTFGATAYDPDNGAIVNGRGIANVKFFYHKNDGQWNDGQWRQFGATDTTTPYTQSLATSGLAVGNYIAVVNLTDDEGQMVTGSMSSMLCKRIAST